MSHQPIEELDCFLLFEEVAQWTWRTVRTWDIFAQKTIGEQLVRAVDSINANLAEGDGRYSTGDSVRFFVIARASAREGKLWIQRAIDRDLCTAEEGQGQIAKIVQAAKLLNLIISYRRKNEVPKRVSECLAAYGTDEAWP